MWLIDSQSNRPIIEEEQFPAAICPLCRAAICGKLKGRLGGWVSEKSAETISPRSCVPLQLWMAAMLLCNGGVVWLRDVANRARRQGALSEVTDEIIPALMQRAGRCVFPPAPTPNCPNLGNYGTEAKLWPSGRRANPIHEAPREPLDARLALMASHHWV